MEVRLKGAILTSPSQKSILECMIISIQGKVQTE
jgi:hypothetical protein